MILKNAIQTPDGTILQSYHRHDFKTHIDTVTGHLYGVDGGTAYLRRLGPPGYIELSVLDDENHVTRRENLHWGKNFDKDNNRLEETQWVLIKDLEDSHLENIIKYFADRGVTEGDILNILKDEIEYRRQSKSD